MGFSFSRVNEIEERNIEFGIKKNDSYIDSTNSRCMSRSKELESYLLKAMYQEAKMPVYSINDLMIRLCECFSKSATRATVISNLRGLESKGLVVIESRPRRGNISEFRTHLTSLGHERAGQEFLATISLNLQGLIKTIIEGPPCATCPHDKVICYDLRLKELKNAIQITPFQARIIRKLFPEQKTIRKFLALLGIKRFFNSFLKNEVVSEDLALLLNKMVEFEWKRFDSAYAARIAGIISPPDDLDRSIYYPEYFPTSLSTVMRNNPIPYPPQSIVAGSKGENHPYQSGAKRDINEQVTTRPLKR